MIGGCPIPQQYNFTIPSYAPPGVALFAWTWFNEIGNREMYMNCAHVQIIGSSARRRSRSKRQSTFTSLNSLPNIYRANTLGLNDCSTTPNMDIVFPEPGPDVLYSGTRSSSSPIDTQIGCDTATPLGQTYENLGDTPSVNSSSPSTTTSPAPISSATGSSVSSSSSGSSASSASSGGGVFAEAVSTSSTSR
jgi:hypothetical protein